MEEQEEFYRTLCSSETLRSGKKGFFHDFSEHVMLAAGGIWTSKIYGRIDRDEHRLRAVFVEPKIKGVVLETLKRVTPLFRDKDANISRNRRLEAFQLASAGEREKALLLFSQAVLRAPPIGKCKDVDRGYSLPLALLGRAEVFLALKEYELVLEDLALAAEDALPDELQIELNKKKEEAERCLEKNRKALVSMNSSRKTEGQILPPLTGGPNLRLPAASSSLEIVETQMAGKEAVAVKDIRPGDSLVIEPPLASCLLPDFYGTHCHHCYSRLRAPVGCPKCSTVAFCGTQCRNVAISTYHKYECEILALLIGSGMSVLSTLALRMVTQETFENCLRIHDRINKEKKDQEENGPEATILSKSAKRRNRRRKRLAEESRNEKGIENISVPSKVPLEVAYDLVRHQEKRQAKDFLERSLMAAFLLRCLQRVSFFENSTTDDEVPNEQELAIGSLLLKNLQLLQFNAHEFYETRLGMEHRFHGSRPVYLGVAIYPTVARFNHDCYPAVTRYFVGKNIVIRAIRSLKPGDVVAENYGPIFTKRNLGERQRSLIARYWFKCTCKACQEDWPVFEKQTNDFVRLRCPTAGCKGLHRRPCESQDSVKCNHCGERVNLKGLSSNLKDCEELYAKGFAVMEEQKGEEAKNIFIEALEKFHKIAVPPHKDTHLAEVALSACMADSGNTWRPPILVRR